MIVRTQDGWMKYLDSVAETIDQVAAANDNFGGIFHTNHIALFLANEGCIVTDTPAEVRGKAVISKKQIRAALNSQARSPYNPKIRRTKLDWYQVLR
jgi:hypothetical protein